MAKLSNQKTKLPVLTKILLTETDEAHPMTVRDIIAALSAYGIPAERKSIYDDLEALRQLGLDVISVKGKTTGYFIGARDFELPELKLLVDAVQSSRFITAKKSTRLIQKIASLASRHEARWLKNNVVVAKRIKSMNESIYLNVDRISDAIEKDRNILFQYFEWNSAKEKVLRRGGAFYRVSPFFLAWDNENYYLVGFDADKQNIRHFRVDKMLAIRETEEKRDPAHFPRDLDPAEYSGKLFGMFGGAEESVVLFCDEKLAGVVIDRFGQEPVFFKREGGFEVTLKVEVSPLFLAWVTSFGNQMEVLEPPELRETLAARADEILNLYRRK